MPHVRNTRLWKAQWVSTISMDFSLKNSRLEVMTTDHKYLLTVLWSQGIILGFADALRSVWWTHLSDSPQRTTRRFHWNYPGPGFLRRARWWMMRIRYLRLSLRCVLWSSCHDCSKKTILFFIMYSSSIKAAVVVKNLWLWIYFFA